ncbi:hypothetical protein [Mycoplasma leonicaptivi]|uniref:hypothetical protein n=1 Tax=Mycoplasma leonicaptivi TaxID=36742 RepID=UPI0004857B89|nr:hypothetical protein [Mycoplasma leonicaptivi]
MFLNSKNKNNLILNDIKTDNFILDKKENNLSFIDLENSFKKNQIFKSKIKNEYENKIKSNLEADNKKIFFMFLDFFFDYKIQSKININSYLFEITKYKNNEFVFNFIKILFSIFGEKFNTNLNLTKKHNKKLFMFFNKNNCSKIMKFKNLTDIFNTINEYLFSDNFNFRETLKNIENHNYIKSKEYISIWFENIVKDINPQNYFYKNNNYYTPYLLDGTSGIIYIILYFSYKFNDLTFLNQLEKIIISFSKILTRKLSLGLGITGIWLIIYLYYKVLNNKCNIIKLDNLSYIGMFIVNNKLKDYNFEEMKNSFINGYVGIYYLYLLLLKEENEKIF